MSGGIESSSKRLSRVGTEGKQIMTATEPIDFGELIERAPSFGPDDVRRMLGSAVGAGAVEFRRAVEQALGSPNPTAKVRSGIGLFFLGQHQRAVDALDGVKEGIGQYYRGCALSTLGKHEEAAEAFRLAGKGGYPAAEAKLREAGELRMAGDLDKSEQLIRSTGSEGARLAEYSYQMGCILFDRGDTFGAIEYFERAVDMDPHHARALFALALENSLHGNDDEAIKLYERCLSKPPYYVGALLNLGLLYEDSENYGCAQYCFEKVLQHDPSNERALLYLKDIEATSNMYYDEETLRAQQKMEQLLSRPVTDFELSVRSRNCLSAMDIDTLGDLTRTSEQELLAGKNFGETSLDEVRELMKLHGLSIGQNMHDKAREPSFSFKDLSPQEQAMMSMPVVDLDLSVRSRKCMTRLGITTVGELVARTPDELLSAKNFGVTSLNEIRAKLSEQGMRLRND
ncbi:MAG: DNA-directed RNA polymerase subunit alpha C-terminal domain-containing protein [Planctomycetaceae bacterium]